LPQGSLKKIEFDLLLANFALEICEPSLCLRKLVGRGRFDHRGLPVRYRSAAVRADRKSFCLGGSPTTA